MAAMAVVAIGMFVGTWVIGPAITHDSADAPVAAKQERATFEDMVARPDPSPYRAATPAFDITATNYAAAAKEKAQAELGGQTADSEAVTETRSVPRAWSRNIPAFDRHRIY